jgi:hypothetical protein
VACDLEHTDGTRERGRFPPGPGRGGGGRGEPGGGRPPGRRPGGGPAAAGGRGAAAGPNTRAGGRQPEVPPDQINSAAVSRNR